MSHDDGPKVTPIISEIISWMRQHLLNLNHKKTKYFRTQILLVVDYLDKIYLLIVLPFHFLGLPASSI